MSPHIEPIDFLGRPVPRHVPPELMRYIDLYDDPRMATDPHDALRPLRGEPPVVYNLHNPMKGQSWLLTRAEEVREVLAAPSMFSSVHQTNFAQAIGESWKLGPVEMDPPEHGKYRQLMNPWFSPKVVAALTARIRTRAAELVEALLPAGGCEFMSAFGMPFPVSIFLEIMGLPASERDRFLTWVDDIMHATDLGSQADAARAAATYLRGAIASRVGTPADDITSKIANAEIDGVAISDDDKLGLAYVLFLGGLDSVAASLGHFFRHLATHPENQATLRRDPALIPKAIEEFLRAFAVTTAMRQVTQDTRLAGIDMKAGDWVTLPYPLVNLDPQAFEHPDEVDLNRRQIRHFAFSSGPHFCLGAHLARREFQVALTEWLERVPPFRMKPGVDVVTRGGIILGVTKLEIEWG